MEKRTSREGEGSGVDSADTTFGLIVDSIQKLAASNARAPLSSEEAVLNFLKSWWSKTYNRPLKDPLLLSYTTEELLYEFYDKIERQKAAEESSEQEADKIEEAKEKQALDWAELEEKKELEELARKQATKNESSAEEPAPDPTKDENNIKWMKEQLEHHKKIFGDDFGEDLNLSLDE